MGVLKRKQESEAITLKLPAALKREIEQLRSRAEGGLRSWRDHHGGDVAALQADQGRARRRISFRPENEWPRN